MLTRAEQIAGLGVGDWSRRVLARVDEHGAAISRELPVGLSLDELLGELQQEGLDLGGWAIMTVQVARLGLEGQAFGAEELVHLRERLEMVASLGALADAILRQVRRDLADRQMVAPATATPGG